MRHAKNRAWLAIGCLLVGLCGGAVGAQVFNAVLNASYLNSGLFSMAVDDAALFHVTLDDTSSGLPARVRLEFLDEAGVVVSRKDVDLLAGQSTTLRIAGEGEYRAHAQVLDPDLRLTGRRAVVGAVEVFDLTTGQRGPVCSVDYSPSDGGRQ